MLSNILVAQGMLKLNPSFLTCMSPGRFPKKGNLEISKTKPPSTATTIPTMIKIFPRLSQFTTLLYGKSLFF